MTMKTGRIRLLIYSLYLYKLALSEEEVESCTIAVRHAL